jgi:dCTP deaminase
MILSDSQLRKRIESGDLKIQTEWEYDVMEQIGPASIDFRLGHFFKIYKKSKIASIDPRDPSTLDGMTELSQIAIGDYFMLHPGQFVLGVTMEKIRVPYDLVCRCEGRSSLGRLGIVIHSTAGFIDPGFEWTITLEITNINEVPIKLYPGMRFGQFAFQTIEGTVDVPYDQRKWSKYMHQTHPEESKIMEDLH